jgi:uncharacterized damage-inducible protein DinB
MFTQTYFQTMFDYQFHISFRLLDVALNLSESETRENPGYGRGSIHDLFFHILGAHRDWRLGLETGLRPAPLNQDDYPDIPALKSSFKAEQKAHQDYLNSLSDEDIQGEVTLTWGVNSAPFARWRVFQHLAFHSMQHHTEIAQLLTEKGQVPGDIDFIFFN